MFPKTRLRRNRITPWLRDMVNESFLTANDLILPIFVTEGENIREEIPTLPGVFKLSKDQVLEEVKLAENLGIRAISLFPAIDHSLKSEYGEEAYNSENLICATIRYIKNYKINVGIICDVALDPYTTHGHDGIIDQEDNYVDNDKTIEALKAQALTLGKAGADILAPSDMMDGRVSALREYLDENNYSNLPILSYSAKFASNFYSPFRDALGNTNIKIDKKTYQMDPRNIKEALREVELDITEGADMVMIKPGLPYLDIIHAVSSQYNIPVFAYQVSAEYAMLKFAANAGAIDFSKTLIETLTCFKRAGARAIFTYGAIEAAKILRESN